MADVHKCGMGGGMARIAMPKDCAGKLFRRKIHKNGQICFKEVTE